MMSISQPDEVIRLMKETAEASPGDEPVYILDGKELSCRFRRVKFTQIHDLQFTWKLDGQQIWEADALLLLSGGRLPTHEEKLSEAAAVLERSFR